MTLVNEYRQSGSTNAAWFNEKMPDPVGKTGTLNLTSHKQEVVCIAIEPETSPTN